MPTITYNLTLINEVTGQVKKLALQARNMRDAKKQVSMYVGKDFVVTGCTYSL